MNLPMEPNERRIRKRQFRNRVLQCAIVCVVLAPILMLGLPLIPTGFATIMAIVFLASLILTPLDTISVTRRPTPGTERDIGDMHDVLIGIARTGLSPVDRPAVQRAIDKGAASLHQILGEEPWIAGRRLDTRYRLKADLVGGEDTHPIEIAAAISTFGGDVHDLGMSQVGVPTVEAYAVVGNKLPALVAIARAFDLDVSGLAPDHGRLRGMVDRAAKPLEGAATRVHMLARHWLETDRGGIAPILRLEADAAAGRDLRDLEHVWMDARLNAAPEQHAEIDMAYRRATDALAATLETAIDALATTSADALSTHVGYIEAKHGAGSLAA